MKTLAYLAAVSCLAFLTGCHRTPHYAPGTTLSQARQGFKTHLSRLEKDGDPAPVPPPGVLNLVRYPAPLGACSAYVTPLPRDGKKHPAIIWITGGDCNAIDEGVWQDAPPENDQTARAFREAGIIMMYPSLRGGSNNPGTKEGFYGEVNDVLAAADYLAKQPGVDSKRLYLGGHSTGGTLVLLTAEMSPRFRAVFSFGPVDNVRRYGTEFLPISLFDPQELALRSPGLWLDSIRSSVLVFEGDGQGNVEAVRAMTRGNRNPNLRFFIRPGADHFSILAPTTRLLAKRIREVGGSETFTFVPKSVSLPLRRID